MKTIWIYVYLVLAAVHLITAFFLPKEKEIPDDPEGNQLHA